MKNASKPKASSNKSAAAARRRDAAPFDTNCSPRPSKPVRVGNLVRARVAQLAALSNLPFVQQDLFDRNPGPWQLDDEDHVMSFAEIWDRIVARNPKLREPQAQINWSPEQIKQLCERFYEGGREYESKTPRSAASCNPFFGM